ncbi:MAG: hypothetical protein Q7T72_03130 [Bacteroidales bacterium]|nr:hypothetical protein [Bacteroidales bacterium]MDP3002560.1 hypothetical protein [Bacteroidales bacterium]
MIKYYLINIFNNREIVLIIYLLIFISWTLTQKKIRESIFNVLKVLTGRLIFLSIITLLLYISLIIYGLYFLKFWDFSMLKDSIYWTFGVGFILMMNSNKALQEDHYFKKILRDNFKLVLILEFVVGLYVFGLITEFILMPFVIFFSLMIAYTEVYKEYFQVKNLLQIVFGIIGTGYLIYSGYMIYQDFNEFTSYNTLKSFLFPILMTFLFLPFAYFYALYMHYESLFVRLQSSLKDDKALRRYAKKRVLIAVNFSLLRLKKITSGFLFNQCKTKDDIKMEIKKKLS